MESNFVHELDLAAKKIRPLLSFLFLNSKYNNFFHSDNIGNSCNYELSLMVNLIHVCIAF